MIINLKMENIENNKNPKEENNLSFKKNFDKIKNINKKELEEYLYFDLEKEKINYIIFEENEIDEINDILKEIKKSKTININKNNNNINLKSKRRNECKEILSILNNPFKPLLKPKIISLKGRVLYNNKSE